MTLESRFIFGGGKTLRMYFQQSSLGPSAVELLLNQNEGKVAEGEPDGPVELKRFLDEDDLLPEIRADNRRLIDFLAQEQILSVCGFLPNTRRE